jgi:SAM-dependent methyltransferase
MHALDSLLAEIDRFAEPAPDAALWARLDWLDRLELWLPGDDASPRAQALRQRREAVEAVNRDLYAALRRAPPRLRALLASHPDEGGPAAAEGFDARDELLAGVLDLPVPDAPRTPWAADMVAYQPTPVRHGLDLLRRSALTEGDVLVDLGSGLGQVPLLAALCSPARAVGIEIESGYVATAQAAASTLGLSRATFVCADLRQADLSQGSVFYLYTPLRGALLEALLARLRDEARRRPLRIAGFGPCVEVLAAQDWLRPRGPVQPHRVAIFDRAVGAEAPPTR